MKRIALAVSTALATLSVPALAAPETYNIEGNHTMPRFEYKHLGYSTQVQRFDKTSGTITLDRAAKNGSLSRAKKVPGALAPLHFGAGTSARPGALAAARHPIGDAPRRKRPLRQAGDDTVIHKHSHFISITIRRPSSSVDGRFFIGPTPPVR